MKIHPGLIGFDIDGVVADTMEAFLTLANQDYGINFISPEDITDFMVEECLPVEPQIIDAIFQKLLLKPIKSGLKPMLDAVDVLKDFAEVAPLTFITARPQKEPIEAWLKKYLGEQACAKMRLEATGEHDDKTRYIKKMGLKYFVDDRFQTCKDISKEGITPFVYNQPWNFGKHELQTVESWVSIRNLCLDEPDRNNL